MRKKASPLLFEQQVERSFRRTMNRIDCAYNPSNSSFQVLRHCVVLKKKNSKRNIEVTVRLDHPRDEGISSQGGVCRSFPWLTCSHRYPNHKRSVPDCMKQSWSRSINHSQIKKKKWLVKCGEGVGSLLAHVDDFNRQIYAAEAQSVNDAAITTLIKRRNKQQYLQ